MATLNEQYIIWYERWRKERDSKFEQSSVEVLGPEEDDLYDAFFAGHRAGKQDGIIEAANAIEEPYPETMFPELSPEQIKSASILLQQAQVGLCDRLHAGWARHWARIVRALKENEDEA